jgi:hypothetical protein
MKFDLDTSRYDEYTFGSKLTIKYTGVLKVGQFLKQPSVRNRTSPLRLFQTTTVHQAWEYHHVWHVHESTYRWQPANAVYIVRCDNTLRGFLYLSQLEIE